MQSDYRRLKEAQGITEIGRAVAGEGKAESEKELAMLLPGLGI